MIGKDSALLDLKAQSRSAQIGEKGLLLLGAVLKTLIPQFEISAKVRKSPFSTSLVFFLIFISPLSRRISFRFAFNKSFLGVHMSR